MCSIALYGLPSSDGVFCTLTKTWAMVVKGEARMSTTVYQSLRGLHCDLRRNTDSAPTTGIRLHPCRNRELRRTRDS